MLSENDEVIQLVRFLNSENSRKLARINKNSRERERARENQDTVDFYTGSPNNWATSSPSYTVWISLN